MGEHSTRISRRTFVGGSAAVGAALCLNPVLAWADPTAADKQAEAQAVLASLNSMQAELGKAETDYHNAVEDQAAAKAKMDEAQARIDEASGQIADLQGKLGTRVRSMYRSGSSTFLDLLLGATTFQEFTTNWDLLNQLNEGDAEMVQQTKDLRAEVEAQQAEYAKQEQVAAEKTAEAKRIQEEAQATVNAMQATYDGLSAEVAQLLEEERAAQAAAEAAAAAQVVEEATTPSTPSGGGSGGSGSTPNHSEPPYNAVTGNAVVDRAYSYIGNAEYSMGACSPGVFDCSGFVAYCLTGSYSRLGSTLTFMNWPRTYDPQPGDVAVNASHCGIYIGNNQMIHCATYGVGVIQGPVQGGMIFVRY